MNKNIKHKGVYFKSDSDTTTEYAIELCEGRFEGSAIVKIYTFEEFKEYNTDDLISWFDWEVKWIAEVDLCGKYFFPKFNNELQLYYDDKEYYQGKTNTNSVTSLMECINYAISYGLKESNIKPY